ncbi:vWA domain-containing protein [Deinococcus maricopensis]|uniref:von Willebrand factor type A n=1 Tax=Deinococcus maricopensis (strain DSM 21211 / LMG 22137 / NRRL B-23946 / LB-34) TaxID=709986 RepID=E8U868_DEIML|nr:VWA domain-containing protein [Deinococcus maricopensis]ADV67257.1 von Willebrand factor type A [Deinococcus maricopensis DSM 21211]
MQITATPATPVVLEGTPAPTDLLLRFREDVPNATRRPLNVALVIDRSGSMAGSPLRYALKAAADFVDRLTETDVLSIVVYDDDVDTLLDAQPVRDKAAIKDLLKGVRAGGITNLSGGWLRGCELVAGARRADAVNRVLLLTDGQANHGVTDTGVLIKTAASKAEAGVSTTTLGFGSSFEEDLLIGMARASGGNFYFIQSMDDAADVFGIELDTMKAVAAQNLTVTLTPAPGVQIADILSLARTDTGADGRVTLHLGDVYENEDKLLGVQLHVSALAAGTHDLLHVTYRADAIRDGQIETLTGELPLQATAAGIEAVAAAGAGNTLDLARLRIARDKERAVDLADAGQHADAAELLRALTASLTARGLHEHFEIAEEIDQLTHYADRLARRTLGNADRKELRDQAFQGRRARADLSGRGVTVDDAARALPVVSDVGSGVELVCFREGGKLRVKVITPGHDETLNVQFPRTIRAEGAHYVVESLERSLDGSFYRARGQITRLVRPGESDPLASFTRGSVSSAPRAVKAPTTLADLEETDTVGSGVLIQCVKDKGKLRARVVSDGYDPNWNMRFPRGIRQEGTLFVVDTVNTGPDGKSYIASGNIRRFQQPQ